MKENIIIINAFPSNDYKISLLREQIFYLKQINIPILLISGCEVPDDIKVDITYLVINTENEYIGKDFCTFLKQNNIHDFAFDFFYDGDTRFDFYWSNVNCTITKNIKLGFSIAKALGYKTAFYTEDDNIWKNGSFDYINDILLKLNSDLFKIGGVLGKQHQSELLMVFTTFFFSNVNYFLDKFILPINSSEWYDINNVNRFGLQRIYEDVFYRLFSDDINMGLFYNTEKQFLDMLENDPCNRKNFAWGIYNRRNDEFNLFKTFFTILPTNKGEKVLILNNRTDYLLDGVKTYNISIDYDGKFFTTLELKPHTYYMFKLDDSVKNVGLIIDNYNFLEISADPNIVVNNGLVNFKEDENNNTINYVMGGRMGDFFQVLYVVQQYYKKTGKKGNIYITDNLSYGGDAFTKPLNILYPDLVPILKEQEYINKFEVFNGQVDNFINLNDWRKPNNLQPKNFPWINLFNKVYLSEFNDLTYEPWIKYHEVNNDFKDVVIIHRAHYRITDDTINWQQLIRDNKCVFVGFDDIQYDRFPYKHMLPFHKINNFTEFCAILNACKFYVGNQTGPFSIAHAMDVPRLCELFSVDACHYVGEEQYFNKLNWVSNVHSHTNLKTIDQYINYINIR